MYLPSTPVDVRVLEHVGAVTLNRPDYGNALTRSMVLQLQEALDDLYYERRVRAIVLGGAGQWFCSGLDPAELLASQTMDDAAEQWGDDAANLRDLLVRMLEVTKPIIAAVNGPAAGIGAALVAASDLVVASPQATLGLPDVRHGLVAGLAAPLVSFRVGAAAAARLMLTGEPLSAEEAQRVGLFHHVTSGGPAWDDAVRWAEQCVAGAPEAIQLSKRLLNETLGEELSAKLAAGAVMAATARTTEAAEEGIAALAAGRSPVWK